MEISFSLMHGTNVRRLNGGSWMDTTEELNGTYFYRGNSNLTPGELVEIIFLEEFCTELGIDAVAGLQLSQASRGWGLVESQKVQLKEPALFQSMQEKY